MSNKRLTNLLALIGLALTVIGIGFAVDPGPPFAEDGVVAVVIGLALIGIAGWTQFGRKAQW